MCFAPKGQTVEWKAAMVTGEARTFLVLAVEPAGGERKEAGGSREALRSFCLRG